MDENGDDDIATVLVTDNSGVSNSVEAKMTSPQRMMVLDGEESALILSGEEKEVLAKAQNICVDQRECTNEGKEMPTEAPDICAEVKECTNDGGENGDYADGEKEVVAKSLIVSVEKKECNTEGVDNEESRNCIAADKEDTEEEMVKKTQVANQMDVRAMAVEKGEDYADHGNILENIAEVKQVKANCKNNAIKLKRKKKVIKVKKAVPVGSRVISKGTNRQALSRRLQNKTVAAADVETDNQMKNPKVGNEVNVDGGMNDEEENKLPNTDAGCAEKEESMGKGVMNDEEMMEVVESGEQVKATSNKNVRKSQKARLKRKKNGGSMAMDARGPRNMKEEASPHKKMNKGSKTMGMIFMCSSKTKMDCYHYKVLGLPASKRDLVLTVYEGMKLFLFDVDLKLLYGIYTAAGPGGYNIEPKAFKSAFPSQVRFAVQEDCLPIPEEKFKTIIKDNYYQKKKFSCELTLEQVNGLCKLFRAASKSLNSKWLKKGIRQPPLKSVQKDRNKDLQRARAEDRSKKRHREVKRSEHLATVDQDSRRKRHKEVERSEPFATADRDRPNKRRRKADRSRAHTSIDHDGPGKRTLELERYSAYVRDMDHGDTLAAYERRSYLPSVPSLELRPRLPAVPAPPSYAYGQNVDVHISRRPSLSENHYRPFPEMDWRRQEDSRFQEDIGYRRAPDDYNERWLRDSEPRHFGVEQLDYRERRPYYDQRHLASRSAYYDAGQMRREPAAPPLDYRSLRSTYRY